MCMLFWLWDEYLCLRFVIVFAAYVERCAPQLISDKIHVKFQHKIIQEYYFFI